MAPTYATVKFDKIVHTTQEIGGPDEHLLASMYVDVIYGDLTEEWKIVVKQIVGSTTTNVVPIEVTFPAKKQINLDRTALRKTVETYWERVLGPGIRGQNNIIVARAEFRVPVLPGAGGGW
jgi:hypothetical protein